MIHRCLLALTLALLTATRVLALDAQEEAVVLQAVDNATARYTSVLERAVNINSGSMNVDGVTRVGKLFAEEFKAIGFTTEWVDGVAFQRAGHLVARRGTSGPKMLLIGHLDTVFASDSPFQRYTAVDQHHAAGPGITDMKGGNVVMLLALAALDEAGLLDRMQLQVVLTGDEELRGRPLDVANAALVDAARWADIALGFEDGDGDPTTAVITRRGSSNWRLEVTGKPAHSSQIFREDIGDGAAFEVARILTAWREALRDEENLTFNPGVVVAGTDVTLDAASGRGEAFGKSNVIARSALVNGGIRAVSPAQLKRAVQIMQNIAADNSPHTAATFTLDEGYPPMPVTEGNRQLLAHYSAISEELGFGPVAAVDPRRAGAADISFAAAHVEQAIDGLGLMGEGGHTVDEVADMRTLPQQAKRAAILLLRLAGE